MKKYKIQEEPYDILEEEKSLRLEDTRLNSIKYNPKQSNTNSMINYNNKIKQQTQTQIGTINNEEMNFTNLEINDDSIMIQKLNLKPSNPQTQTQTPEIDEDLEIFKSKYNTMIENCKIETFKEFSGLKRKLITNHNKILLSEKHKFTSIINAKKEIIENLNDTLSKANNELNYQASVKEKIFNLYIKEKELRYQRELKRIVFVAILKKNYERKKDLRKKGDILNNQYQCKLKQNALNNIKDNWREMTLDRMIITKDNDWQNKMSEMAKYYNKEITQLKQKLKEANFLTEKTKEAKNAIQDNFKKVLMRGVMTMNKEAMYILNKDLQVEEGNVNTKVNDSIEVKQIQTEGEDKENDINQSLNVITNDNNQLANYMAIKKKNKKENKQSHQFAYNTTNDNTTCEKKNSLLVPGLNIKTKILQKEVYESEINMEILDTCKSEEMSSRRDYKAQYSKSNNTNTIANCNEMKKNLSNNKANCIQVLKEKQRVKDDDDIEEDEYRLNNVDDNDNDNIGIQRRTFSYSNLINKTETKKTNCLTNHNSNNNLTNNYHKTKKNGYTPQSTLPSKPESMSKTPLLLNTKRSKYSC